MEIDLVLNIKSELPPVFFFYKDEFIHVGGDPKQSYKSGPVLFGLI